MLANNLNHLTNNMFLCHQFLGISRVYTLFLHIHIFNTFFHLGSDSSVWTLFTCSEGQQILLSSISCCFVRHHYGLIGSDYRLIGADYGFFTIMKWKKWSTLLTDCLVNLKSVLVEIRSALELWLHICLIVHFTHLFVSEVRASSSTRTLKFLFKPRRQFLLQPVL